LPETAHNAAAKVSETLESQQKTMKPKHLSLAIAALLAAVGLWFAWSAWRTHASRPPSLGIAQKGPNRELNPGQILPRKGHGPGG
jgi:ABC-type nickel/cobalt efflux system permease component RcnA